MWAAMQSWKLSASSSWVQTGTAFRNSSLVLAASQVQRPVQASYLHLAPLPPCAAQVAVTLRLQRAPRPGLPESVAGLGLNAACVSRAIPSAAQTRGSP